MLCNWITNQVRLLMLQFNDFTKRLANEEKSCKDLEAEATTLTKTLEDKRRQLKDLEETAKRLSQERASREKESPDDETEKENAEAVEHHEVDPDGDAARGVDTQ